MPDTTLSIQIQVQAGELKRLRKDHDSLVRKIQGDWKTTSRRVQADSDRMFKGLVRGFKTVGVAIAAVKIVDFGRSIVQVGVRMEGLRSGLVAVEGSTKAAAKAMAELQRISLLPGISLSQAIEARINLRAVKLNADLANRSIKAMGNALAIVGKSNELSGVVLGMVQMTSAGKVLQEEINQISQRIPQFRQAMKEAFGTARSEEIQKMGISVEDFLSRTVEQLEKLPKATGGAANAISNLGNAFTKFGDNLFQKFLPQFKATVEFMGDIVNKASDVIAPREGVQTPALIERFRLEDLSGQVVKRFRRQEFRTPNPNIARNQRALQGATLDIRLLKADIVRDFSAETDPFRRAELLRQGRELEAIRQQSLETLRVDRVETARRLPGGARTKLVGGIRRNLQPRGGIGLTPFSQNIPRPSRVPFEPGAGFDTGQIRGTGLIRTSGGQVISQAALTQNQQRGFQAGGTAGFTGAVAPVPGLINAPRLPIIRPDIQPIRAPERLPVAPRDFLPAIKKFETGMKQATMSTIQATTTIVNVFADMAAGIQNSTLQIAASLLDMVSRVLSVVQQGGGGGVGSALTTLGVGVGLSTGLGIGLAAVGGGIAVANTIQAESNRNKRQRVQTRFLRTN